MKDVRSDLGDLYRRLARNPPETGGRSVMFLSARSGEGVSSIAASFALLAARQARRAVWLVDVDLRRNHLFNSFAVGRFAQSFGGVGPPYSAALKTQPFFSIEPPPAEGEAGLGMFTAHRVGETRLMVTHFDAARLAPGQALRIRSQPAYWQAVRAVTDWAVVDAPALELSGAGLALASQMDHILIVVRADATRPEEVEAVRRQVEAHGGRVTGAVLSRRRADARLTDSLP